MTPPFSYGFPMIFPWFYATIWNRYVHQASNGRIAFRRSDILQIIWKTSWVTRWKSRTRFSLLRKWLPNLSLVGGFNPSEKYVSIGMIILNIWKTCSKPPTRSGIFHDEIHGIQRRRASSSKNHCRSRSPILSSSCTWTQRPFSFFFGWAISNDLSGGDSNAWWNTWNVIYKWWHESSSHRWSMFPSGRLNNQAIENHCFFIGTIHCKWPFSIAMLNYQRVVIQEGNVADAALLRILVK